jgi:ABC-2 type transport system ATP-binding protein
MPFCGFCGSEITLGTKICPSCGSEQPEEPTANLIEETSTAPTSFCGFCGAPMDATAAHCTTCGRAQPTLLEEAEALARPTQAEPTRPTRFPSPESYSHTIVVPPTPRPPSPQRTDQIDQMVAVRNLSVIRGKKKLVEGIDFTVNRGEIVGLMGPSGAGKTTIIKVLTTEYPAESGQVAVGGYDLTTQSQSAKQVFGYVPQETQLYEDLTFLQNVTYFGGQYGLDQAYLIERAQRLASVVELGDRINDKVGRFSGGQKKRVSVATALAHNPDLLVLDEPTSGLDPATRRSLWKFLKSVNQSYMVTMLITTHFLDEGEYCDKLLIINKGHMVAYDSPRNLKRKMPGEGKAIELEMFTLDDYVSAKLFEFEARAKRERVAEMVDRSGYRVKVFCRNIPESLSRIPALLSELGLGFKALDIVDTSLEDVFIYLTGEHFKEEE